MPANRAKIDYRFDHLIEHRRSSMLERDLVTIPVLLGLLAIMVAAALFSPAPTPIVTHRTAEAALVQLP